MHLHQYVWPAVITTAGLAGASAILAFTPKRWRVLSFALLFGMSWLATWMIYGLASFVGGKAAVAEHLACEHMIARFTTELEADLRHGSISNGIERLARFNHSFYDMQGDPISFAQEVSRILELNSDTHSMPQASSATTNHTP